MNLYTGDKFDPVGVLCINAHNSNIHLLKIFNNRECNTTQLFIHSQKCTVNEHLRSNFTRWFLLLLGDGL